MCQFSVYILFEYIYELHPPCHQSEIETLGHCVLFTSLKQYVLVINS